MNANYKKCLKECGVDPDEISPTAFKELKVWLDEHVKVNGGVRKTSLKYMVSDLAGQAAERLRDEYEKANRKAEGEE